MKLLFICTHNRCRSILAEAISRQLGAGILDVASAGSAPVDIVHPLSLRYLRKKGFNTANLQSQSWHELESFQPDIVITVCDHAAKETCPLWMKNSKTLHWGLPDPSRLAGSEADIEQAFFQVMSTIEEHVHKLLSNIK